MDLIILMDGQFYLATMDDHLLLAISDPIPRGLVPLTAEERREDWARLYDTPMQKVVPPRDLSEVPFEMVHHCEWL